ncbi:MULTISPECIES: magnesium and cobalt transport protein CorA [unclassified Microbacterium]|uniref:magnesium and cobalt transport protein CorA n=1 Tax=unclassified Microbacterium TaxID=2609290 RepID=UPI00214B3DAB|nr:MULTISPECIES: magnesium and cobalt transport protein CorA [unclassified Microbacterium]MCR2809664.1 magnesium and cobalt transport protein CorA [Microbacterium sp. zg.B185]WIM18014.1 magnesium and cobalt transport protein CorA [Microbacterium sp. zg-B185]
MALIDSAVYVGSTRIGEGAPPAEAIRQARAEGGMVWIGLRSPDAGELGELQTLLDLHPLAVKDSLRGHQRAKFERFGRMSFLVVQPAAYVDETETVEFAEVDFFVGDDFIVTVQDDDIDVRGVRAELEEHPTILAKGTYGIVWALLSRVLDAYGPVVDGVENDIDEIEQELFSQVPDVSRRIFGLQREVIDLQHATSPLLDIFERLQVLFADEADGRDAPAFRELGDRAGHIVDRVDAFRHTLDNALTIHTSLVEQQNNEAMRRMTEAGLQQNEQVKKVSGWAAILFAPTLVGTIYGMNFDNMPELHWTFGYPLALLAMLCTSVTLYAIFKRRGWL